MTNSGFLSTTLLWFLVCILFDRVSTIESLVASPRIRNSIGVLPTTKPWPLDYNCYDLGNNPYVNDIPHPTNCSIFFKCVPDAQNKPQPVPQNCPPTLWFNFDTCNCDYPAITTCYDHNDEDHLSQKFKCACPLVKYENGIYVRNGEDDKCASF